MAAFGPTFGDECSAAGLVGLPFSWASDGTIKGRESLTVQQNAALDAIIKAHDPAKQLPRLVPKSLILSRITDEQLDAALALMTPRQRERWRSPDTPAVTDSNPEVIGLLRAIGADPEAVLAPGKSVA